MRVALDVRHAPVHDPRDLAQVLGQVADVNVNRAVPTSDLIEGLLANNRPEGEEDEENDPDNRERSHRLPLYGACTVTRV